VNAHNGKPITNECVNVWLGPSHGADLIAPTNKDEVVALHLARKEMTADSVARARATELPFLAQTIGSGTLRVTEQDDLREVLSILLLRFRPSNRQSSSSRPRGNWVYIHRESGAYLKIPVGVDKT
jgi:hypothetical protein